MKKIIPLFLLTLTSHVWAHKLDIGDFDQAKLDEVLRRLPDSVSTSITTRPWFSSDYKIKTTFPKNPNAFKIVCESQFYNDSPYPSETHCDVTVDMKDPRAVLKNDVVRVILRDKTEVQAVFDAIPYSQSKKKFYSYGRDKGVTFTGLDSTVYHYQVLCTTLDCRFYFSNKVLEEENNTDEHSIEGEIHHG